MDSRTTAANRGYARDDEPDGGAVVEFDANAEADARVLRQLQGTDAERRLGLETLYLRYAERIRRYYRNHGAAESEAEDWVQETFVRVMRFVGSVREENRLAAWLWRTARNVMIDAIRRTPREQGVDDEWLETLVDDNTQAPADQVADQRVQECVREGFAQFAADHPERAQCLVWAVVDGLGMQEIAEILDRSHGATREYISQCRKKLRPYLLRCFDEID